MAGCTLHQASNARKPLVPGSWLKLGLCCPASARSYSPASNSTSSLSAPAVTVASCLIANRNLSMDLSTIYFDRVGSLYV